MKTIIQKYGFRLRKQHRKNEVLEQEKQRVANCDVSFTYNVYIGIFDRDKHDAVMRLNQI